MEVIKKAYHQESECEPGEVSPREVGHNIYILAQQVTEHQPPAGRPHPPLPGFAVSEVEFCLSRLFAARQTQQSPAEPPETSEEEQRGRRRNLLDGELDSSPCEVQ